MKTKIIVVLNILFAFFIANLSAADFNAFENEQILDVLEFRFNTRKLSSDEEAITAIKKYHQEKLAPEIQSKLGEEAKLTIDNMFTIAEYTYLSESDAQPEVLKALLTNQFNKAIAWNENHPLENANPYYLFSTIDVINCSMQFLPQKQMIKYGLESKSTNDLFRNNNPDFAIAYTCSGLWYQVAPAIGGGSKKLAKEYFYTAIQKAGTNYEKYYANIYYSQVCFEEKNLAECNKYLEIAEALIPGGRYTAFLRKINSLGYSLFDYSNNKSKIDSKL